MDTKALSNEVNIAELIGEIKNWEERRHKLQKGQARNLNKAYSYYHINRLLSSLWLKILEATKAPRHFSNVSTRLNQNRLSTEIIKWNYESRLVSMGRPNENMLAYFENMKEKFENLETRTRTLKEDINRFLSVINNLKNSYQECESKCDQLIVECENYRSAVDTYIRNLMHQGIIIFQHPPSVLEFGKNSIFDMEIRFCAGAISGFLIPNMEVEALLISEHQARRIINGTIKPQDEIIRELGQINSVNLQLTNDHYLIAKFLNVRLRLSKNIDEMLCHILFRVQINRLNCDGTFQSYLHAHPPLWAILLPFLAIDEDAPRKYGQARMFWRIAFAIDDHTNLYLLYKKNINEQSVPWSEYFNALNFWFKKLAAVQRGLDEYETFLLEDKIGFRNANNYMENVMTWALFYEKSDSSDLPFWDWIYPIAIYLSQYPQYWESSLILGFASKSTIENLLSKATEPSMILTFSNTQPWTIVGSCAYWTTKKKIEHIQFDKKTKEFANKTLIECIRSFLSQRGIKKIKILPSNKYIADFYALESTPNSVTEIIKSVHYLPQKPPMVNAGSIFRNMIPRSLSNLSLRKSVSVLSIESKHEEENDFYFNLEQIFAPADV